MKPQNNEHQTSAICTRIHSSSILTARVMVKKLFHCTWLMKNNALCPIVFKSFIAVFTTLWYYINVILAALCKESCLHSPFKILFRSLALTDFLRLDLFFRTDSMIVEYKKKQSLVSHVCAIKKVKTSKQTNNETPFKPNAFILHLWRISSFTATRK